MSNRNDTLKRHAGKKTIQVEHERADAKRIAEREVIKLEQSHHVAQLTSEERYSTLEHTALAARQHFTATIQEKDRETHVLRSELRVAKTEEEQTGEAWSRANDELQTTKEYPVPQATSIFNKSKADNDKYVAELEAMAHPYQNAASELKRKTHALDETKQPWAQLANAPNNKVMKHGTSTQTSSAQLGTIVMTCMHR